MLRGSLFKWPRGPFSSCRYQSEERRGLLDLRRHPLADDHDALILVEGDGLGFVDFEVLAMMIAQTERPVLFMHAKNAFECVDVEPRGERGVFQRLRHHVPRCAVSLQLDDNYVPLAIYAQQVDDPAKVGTDLTSDDQNPPVFEDPVGVGLQPLLEDGFLNDRSRTATARTP